MSTRPSHTFRNAFQRETSSAASWCSCAVPSPRARTNCGECNVDRGCINRLHCARRPPPAVGILSGESLDGGLVEAVEFGADGLCQLTGDHVSRVEVVHRRVQVSQTLAAP